MEFSGGRFRSGGVGGKERGREGGRETEDSINVYRSLHCATHLQNNGVGEGLGLQEKGKVLHHFGQATVDGLNVLVGAVAPVPPLLPGQNPTL